jgi:nucleotide-binding universal stress UspA family protein
MFKTIVWAADGSENAARALPYAKALATGEDAMLVAAHIVPATTNDKTGDRFAADVYDGDDGARLTKLVGELSRDGLTAIHKVVNYVGHQPAQGIADIAREVGADVIVVGTRGHSALGGLVVGSVTQRLLHVAPCPVLAMPQITPPAAELRDLEAARQVA